METADAKRSRDQTREGGRNIHSVLLQVTSGPKGQHVMDLAIGLAGRWGARVIGLSAALPHRPHDTYSGLVLASVAPGEADLVESRLLAARDRFLKIAGDHGVKAEWRSVIHFPAWALCDAATAADIVVVGRGLNTDEEGLYQTVVVGDLLMGVGRPVLLLPEQPKAASLNRLLVAWKGGREGRRMLADALPIMRLAERVSLVHISEPLTDSGTLRQALHYLLERGVVAESFISSCDGGSVADVLMKEAEDRGAEAIIAGAYGHSRLREWCFGGVTRALLTRCSLPCVLSH